jgi:hypothetical protein
MASLTEKTRSALVCTCLGLLSLVLFGSDSAGQMMDSDTEPVYSTADIQFFESNVRPLLIEHCHSCHASDSDRIRGGLVLDTRAGWLVGGISGPAIIPGNPDASPFIHAIRWDDEDFQMPPKRRLSDREISVFEEWIRRGAPDPRVTRTLGPDEVKAMAIPGGGVPKSAGDDHWSFQPVSDPSVPNVTRPDWCDDDIDAFILARLESEGLKPVRDADRVTLFRRLSFDLRGHQPSVEEQEAFMADRSPRALETVVDRFLDSHAFGERWGRHWLDVARFAESSGKENDVPYPQAWRYRDWVINALNEDMAYDDFIVAQLAGDLLAVRTVDDAASNLVATGYLAVGSKSHNERNRRQFVLDVADEQIDSVTQGLLGLTVACARCHDHKYDPVSQKDYYRLAGVFTSTETLFGGTQGARSLKSDIYTLPNEESISLGMPIPVELRERSVAIQERGIEEIERLRAQVEREGRDSEARTRLRQRTNAMAPIIDLLERYDEDGMPTEKMRTAMGVRDRDSVADTPLLVRGELDKPSDVMPRGVPAIVHLKNPLEVERGSGRYEFANWIASESNPLTARVMVNRIWLHLFGKGIVTSTENFGLEGVPPTHPELLDHLAARFIESGWSVKTLIREIVTSHAYRLSSRENTLAMNVDPENHLIWRMSPKRLEGEAIRDAILHASGNFEIAPPSGSPIGWVAGRTLRPEDVQTYLDASNIRSVYLPQMRSVMPEFLQTFDAAEPSFVTGDRSETNVPSQALFLLNNDWVISQSDVMAKDLLGLQMTDDSRITSVFQRTLGRRPTSSERSAVRAFFKDFGVMLEDGIALNEEALYGERFARLSPQRRAAFIRRREARGEEIPSMMSARQAALSALCQSLFASAEFRYVR